MDASRRLHLGDSGLLNRWCQRGVDCSRIARWVPGRLLWGPYLTNARKPIGEKWMVWLTQKFMKKMDTSFTVQKDTEILRMIKLLLSSKGTWKLKVSWRFCCRFTKKVPSTFATSFWCFVCYSFFSKQLQIQGTIFVALLQALPRVPSVNSHLFIRPFIGAP